MRHPSQRHPMGGSGSSDQKKEEAETESRVINFVSPSTMNQVSIHGSTLLAIVAMGVLLMLMVLVMLKCLSRRGCFKRWKKGSTACPNCATQATPQIPMMTYHASPPTSLAQRTMMEPPAATPWWSSPLTTAWRTLSTPPPYRRELPRTRRMETGPTAPVTMKEEYAAETEGENSSPPAQKEWDGR